MKKFSSKQKIFLSSTLLAYISVIHTSSGYPLVFPCWFLEQNNKIYFTTFKKAKKVKHIKKFNRIGLSVVEKKGFPYLSVSGNAKIIYPGEPLFKEIREKLFFKYDPDGSYRSNNPEEDKLESVTIEIEPKYIFGEGISTIL